MPRSPVLSLLLLLCGCAAPPPADALRLDAAVADLLRSHRVPGASLALVRGGRIAFARGYGLCDAGAARSVGADTVFEACSMSKPVFAYLVMQLVDAGRLDLDRPLDRYLAAPYLPAHPGSDAITARMVLDHTSGLPNWRKGGWREGAPPRLLFAPGTRFGYSGEGFLYLQRVVEAILGEGLDDAIATRVLRPFGMVRSAFVHREALARDAARGHDREGRPKDYRPFDQANAAFTLYTTPTDYARFLVELSAPARTGGAHVSAHAYDAMFSLQPVPDREDAPERQRGLGWVVNAGPGGRFIEHSGSNGTGFRCYARYDRVRGDGLVVMTNGMNGRAVWEALRRLLDRP